MRNQTIVRTALLAVGVVIIGSISAAQGVPIIKALTASDFNALSVVGPVGPGQVVAGYDYNSIFVGQVVSEAFQLSDGNYLYLYQVFNAGPSVLEVVAISPFWDLQAQGYLTANAPTGFADGGVVPYNTSMSYDTGIPLPTVSFNYPSVLGAHVLPNAQTVPLYMVSENPPQLGEVYVIDSGTAVTEAVVPTPEPASLALLAVGGVLLAVRRRRR